MRKILWAVLAVPVIVYTIDSLSLRFLIREPYGVVQVQRFYEVALKNRKTEFMRDEVRPQQCVRSLLPHYGKTPCWYLERHPRQTIKVGSVPDDFWRLP